MNKVRREDVFLLNGDLISPGVYSLNHENNISCHDLIPSITISEIRKEEGPIVCRIKDDQHYVSLPLSADYIKSGDVAIVSKHGLRVVLSRSANSNTLLVTERCNNLCLFCSQPPKDIDDEILLAMASSALIAFQYDGEIGITGGEPFIYKEKFMTFLKVLDEFNVPSQLHILTNGRYFEDKELVNSLASITTRHMTFGIPLYSISSEIHDKLVGKKGAWIQTINGLVNIQYAGFPVEIRFIPTKENLTDLVNIVPFIAKSFPMHSQLSIMNMEAKGLARKNWSQLYVSPKDYSDKLETVAKQASMHGVNVRLFNYPLCHIPKTVYTLAVKSISDWKNNYSQECDSCLLAEKCGGFFSSAKGKFLDQPRAIHE